MTLMPSNEIVILNEVAQEYDLNENEIKLLYTIRKIENGSNASGLEFGVGDGIPNHPARRHKGNPEKSLRLQAQWCAGTIRRRYKNTEDLQAFARRYCPVNSASWHRMAKHWMDKK